MIADPVLARRRRVFVVVAVAAAAATLVVYLVFVRTQWGQEVDDLAFEGRNAVKPSATRRTDRLLGTITVQSLFLLGGAIVTVAVLRRRLRLAITVGAAMSLAVLTTELLKLVVLQRPLFGDVQGVGHNSYPSGHATIAMVLALGLVTVTPRRYRWLSAVVAAMVAVAFGTAVMASGWHRPSDSLGAYAVSLAWFSALVGGITLRRARRALPGDGGDDLDGRLTRSTLWLAGTLVVVLVALVLAQSIGADGLRTVDYAGRYLAAAVLIDIAGVAVVGGYFAGIRDLYLDVQPDDVAPDAPAPDAVVPSGPPGGTLG